MKHANNELKIKLKQWRKREKWRSETYKLWEVEREHWKSFGISY